MKQGIQQFFLALAIVTNGQSVWAQATTKPVAQQQSPVVAAPQVRKVRPTRRPVVVVDDRGSAPQVVTILHRLNGLKMFRLLLRSGEEIDAISRLDDAFKIKDEVHTSVIAGVAMGDGETIAARLPQADAELGPAMAPAAATGPVTTFPRKRSRSR